MYEYFDYCEVLNVTSDFLFVTKDLEEIVIELEGNNEKLVNLSYRTLNSILLNTLRRVRIISVVFHL